MHNDKLVATGDPDADAYLSIAREIHGMDVVLAEATEMLEAGHARGSVTWPPAITDQNPLGYERAASVTERAPALMEEAWERAHKHYRAALDSDPRAAELADLHAGRLWNPDFTLED
ncbi:hypothetical protein [Nonomuraea sp. SYSU D8015]|uniref:hypothetical protein n=1 Tax=Nonomuraea sp. SYSU D8015 TaxID=2593644 RepID=UPI001660CD98|nr:hypothetical protein [Nonomuraea sp. SYSU D8015]